MLINLNARSLCSEKIDELQVTVGIHNVSLVCVSETWFKGYMGNESLSLHGFSLERKDRVLGRAGGVACYIIHDVLYTRLNYIEDEELEVIWIKVMPKRLPRKFSCILLAVVYYTQHLDYLKIRDHIITGIDCIIRKHPECGIVITGDFNQLKTHYRFVQVVRTATRSGAVLDKIWTNMKDVYVSPITISELGKSDHNMVLWKPNSNCPSDRGTVTRVSTRCMGENEKANFAQALSAVRWEPLYVLDTCEEQYVYYQTMIVYFMEVCFPWKVVTRHTADKPWVTDSFRTLVRMRQRAHMSGDLTQARILRNRVNRAAAKLKYDFYQIHVTAISETGSRDWWKNMKKLIGLNVSENTSMQCLANKMSDGNCEQLANNINDGFVSVSEHLPRLTSRDNDVFAVDDELPDRYIISVDTTCEVLSRVKVNKATGPDTIPAWVLKNYAAILAAPLTAIFNCFLREGTLPNEWKMANVIPLPKVNPPASIHKDIRPISLTAIAAKVFETIMMQWVDDIICINVDNKQFGGLSGTSTTDALVEMTHKWYEASDDLDTYVRIVLLDFSKAFDLINHNLLMEKLKLFGIPVHILRWMASFLLDRTQRVKIGNKYSHTGRPNGGVPQGTISGPKCFLIHINDLRTPVPLYKYVDDSTLFEVCSNNGISFIQKSIDIVVGWTTDNDMRINYEKSKEMIISYARDGNFRNQVPNITIENNIIEQVEHVKLLGVTLSNDLTWNRHIDNIVKKAGKRVYMLYQLKRAGVAQSDLVTVYISVVRPVLEYACPVWHTNLPKYLSENIEIVQKRALKAIFPGESYSDILNNIGIGTLKERRDYICEKYFRNMQDSSNKLNHLLPERRQFGYDLRPGNLYSLPVARTNRYRNSLIPWGLYHWQ